MPLGEDRLWTRTLDRYTRAPLLEFVVNRMSGSLPETALGRTQTTDTQSVPGLELKLPDRRIGRQGFYRPHHGDGFTVED